jgi:hypothetical protein
MPRRRFWTAAILITIASIAVIVIAVGRLSTASPAWWTLLTAAAIGQSSLIWLWPRHSDFDAEVKTLRITLASEQKRLVQQQEEFDRVRQTVHTELESREARLEERERDLATRFARFHEFLEYPLVDVHAEKPPDELQKLSEQDRLVRQLLEKEAERVYEKIRRNGYTVNGKVDLNAIREEAMAMIQQVARIYNPDSQNPLLETSFDQLARAASRICLHVLVLLEQLPVSVQHYNANRLYGYIQKAIASYGVYQKASPWLAYATRGMYAGRMLSATNPVTLGAWWLATELGKRGAQKVVENVVNRQAVATLHDLVTVIGVEVAGIYGTGFRQRDAGWVFGAELVELIHCFPISGETLRNGLRQITALPLRSEYDRIYLYRCLADHRSVGLQLADPAMLTREEREIIARNLEAFFSKHVHGTTEANLKKWQDGFERRFDLRLTLDRFGPKKSLSEAAELHAALNGLAGFLESAAGLSETEAIDALDGLNIPLRIESQNRSTTIAEACRQAAGVPFEPPGLDPTSEVTKEFLLDIATCCTVSEQPNKQLEMLACEVNHYFRRTAQHMRDSVGAAWRSRVKIHSSNPLISENLNDDVARAFFELRRENEELAFCYGDLSRLESETLRPLQKTWLLGLQSPDQSRRRAIAVECEYDSKVIWNCDGLLKIVRTPGLIVDNARIVGGIWHESTLMVGSHIDLVVSGRLRGGRFGSYFKDLLAFSGS